MLYMTYGNLRNEHILLNDACFSIENEHVLLDLLCIVDTWCQQKRGFSE